MIKLSEMPLCWNVTNVGKQSKQDIGLKMLLQAMWIELQNGRAAKSFPWFCLWHSEGQENSWEPLQSPADPRCSYLSLFSPASPPPPPISFLLQYLYLSPQ